MILFKLFDRFIIYLAAWAIPSFLLLATIDPRLQAGSRKLTQKNLKNLSDVAFKFKQQTGRNPNHIREISEYAKSSFRKASVYDFYGNKVALHSLDEKHWILRSYGPNNLKGESSGIHKNIFWAPRTWTNLFRKVRIPQSKPPSVYNPVHLLSSSSHKGRYTARIFYNSSVDKKTLVVVKNNRKREPVYVNDIDNPEEFLWLPTSNTLVFTTDPNRGRNESIQVIDIDTLESVSIKLKQTSISVAKQKSALKFHAMLAGTKLRGFYFYATDLFSSPLNPDQFFSSENLYSVDITKNLKPKVKKVENNTRSPYRFIKFKDSSSSNMSPLQKEWSKLSLSGNAQETIENWQSIAIKSSGTPTFPYTLYYLIALYESASEMMRVNGRINESISLKGIASEYARELASNQNAPLWLSLVGWHAWEELKRGKASNIVITGQLEI